MIEGKTGSGFKYSVDERRVKSWKTVKALASMARGSTPGDAETTAVLLVGDILGEEQEERLVNHVEKIYGYADADAVTREFFEIFRAVRSAPGLKNSSSSPDA